MAQAMGGADAREQRIHVVQGQQAFSDDPNVMLTTILGSCVACCLRDPVAGVGGMNHFLLPGGDGPDRNNDLRFGVHSMELLINGLLQRGALRQRMTARLFGGARMLRGLSDVGASNAAFARQFLQDENIAFEGGSLGGDQGRRIQFWPVSGRARQILMPEGQVFDTERTVRPEKPVDSGALELF